jgi:prepilin-type N-terminal cleavage/methylation domain-containing protein
MRPAVFPSSRRDSGFTLTELLIVIAIILVVTAVAAMGLFRNKAMANEASAIGSMRAIASGQKAFASVCGGGAFAASLAVLGAPPVADAAAFIPADLANAVYPMKDGYRFGIAAGAGSKPGPPDCHGWPTVTAFYAWAEPLSIVSGSRSFAVTVNGAVWERSGGIAPTEPFGAPATPIQ